MASKLQQEFTKLSDMKAQLKRTVVRTNDCVKQLSENKLVKEVCLFFKNYLFYSNFTFFIFFSRIWNV